MPSDFSSIVDLNDKSILITGGTGSFGKRFVRTVSERFRPRRLAVFSRDELKQYEMAQLYPTSRYPFLRFFIGDVRDVDRLEMSMRDVDVVIHAAALKQVTTAEYNPFECIHTNVLGAENVATTAIRNGVSRVVALSTDKAVSPVNLYGASKLASDKIFIAANNLSGRAKTRFSVVRYGNVVGSRGSVVPLFHRLIQQGRPTLPITDPRMTRFWITLRQGIDFVLSSLNMMQGGEIYVPKIPSMKIVDLAKAMAPDLPHEIIGVRPGEKLHEAMITEDDARTTIELGDRYIIQPDPSSVFWEKREDLSSAANKVADRFSYTSDTNSQWLDVEAVRTMLAETDSDED